MVIWMGDGDGEQGGEVIITVVKKVIPCAYYITILFISFKSAWLWVCVHAFGHVFWFLVIMC